MIKQPASLVPKALFEGKNSIYHTMGLWAVPVIVSISRRLQFHRRVATMSLNLITEDMNRVDTRRAKMSLKEVLTQLQQYDYILCSENMMMLRNEKAFEVAVLYDLEPFIILYESEFEAITQYHRPAKITRLLTVFLYVVKHINERTKQPTWVTAPKIAEDLGFTPATVYSYLDILRSEIGVLVRMGENFTTYEGRIPYHTRNMAEYLHYKDSKISLNKR